MKLNARLAKLEKGVAKTWAKYEEGRRWREEIEVRRQAAWEIMRPTMSDEHAFMVVEAYAAGSEGYGTPAGTLLQRCLDAMSRSQRKEWPYSQIPPEVTLAMPPEVAEVYLAHPDALPFHDCEDCGYKLPHGYFESCPLCGGRIGWYGYWSKHAKQPAGPSEKVENP
jgi:hypothetical protein